MSELCKGCGGGERLRHPIKLTTTRILQHVVTGLFTGVLTILEK